MGGYLSALFGVALVAVIALLVRLSGKVTAFGTWSNEAHAWNQSVARRLKLVEAEIAALRAGLPAAAGPPVELRTPEAEPERKPQPAESRTVVEAVAARAAAPTPGAIVEKKTTLAPGSLPLPTRPPAGRPEAPRFGLEAAMSAAAPEMPTPTGEAAQSPTEAAGAAAGGTRKEGGSARGGGTTAGGSAASRKPFDWEALIGVRLFSWIAGVALVLAALFFLRYSVEQGWLGAPVRMAMGIATGIALLLVCELKAARRYAVTANAMDAAGIAILFASFYAGHALWHLIGAGLTFGLLALVTAIAVLLAIRRNSIFIALLGLLGGFATPALLATGEDRPIGLFGYLLLLNLGLTWVAYRRRWAVLQALSLAFTALYQLGWAVKFLTEEKLALAVGIFAIFSLTAFVALLLSERGTRRDAMRRESDEAPSPFESATLVSALVPLLFSSYLAAVPAYGAHAGLLFGFLGLMVGGLFAIAIYRGPEQMHLLGSASTMLVLGLWLRISYDATFWPIVLAPIAAFAAFYLAAPFAARRLGRPFTGFGRYGAAGGALLLFTFPLLLAREPLTADPLLPFGVLIVLLGLAAVSAIALEDGRVYFVAAFFGIASEAVWSALRLVPERRLEAFAIYGGLAAFYLGVPFLARRWRKRLAPEGGAAVLLFASLGLLFFLASGRSAEGNLAGLTFLLVLLNLGLFLEGRGGRMPLVAVAGSILSWLVLAKWWSAVALGEHALGALAAVGGFGVLTVAGSAFLLARRAASAGAGATKPVPEQALWVALAGHAFLLFAAGRPELSLPPGPLFAVLLVLDVAIGIAALRARRAPLLLAALAASQALFAVWLSHATVTPWPLVALGAALGVAALGLWALALTRRLAILEEAAQPFAVAALVALLGAQAVAIFAGLLPGAPHFVWLLAGALALLVAELRLAARCDWEGLALLAAVPAVAAAATVGRGAVGGQVWWQALLFAAALWVAFLVDALLVGGGDRRAKSSFLAAILTAAGFFFVAREALLNGGLGDVIGVLPVVQAVMLTPLLVHLVRTTSREDLRAGRDTGRLALVAGAILAFVTVAIPMQLEKQWITLGWALLGAALAWLYRRVPHSGLVLWTVGLELAVFVRLALNPAVFEYHSRQGPPILNWYLYAYLVAAISMLIAAWWLRDTRIEGSPVQVSPGLAAAGTSLLFLLLNIEIADFFSTGETITFGFIGGSAGLPEDLSYTIGWALFSIGLLAAGIVRKLKVVRVCAIALLAVTVIKAFLHDTWRLGGLYRVGSLVGLAVSLALVAVVLQRFVFRSSVDERGE